MENRLLEVKNAIESKAEAQNFTIFKTNDLSSLWADDRLLKGIESILVVEWDGERWGEFLNAAASMEANAIYIDARKFSWDELIERINNFSLLEPTELVKRNKQAEAFRMCDGFVEHLIIAFRAEGLWHVYQETAEWLPKYLELEVEPEEFEEETEELTLPDEMLEKLAEKLARDSAFSKIKNKGDQKTLAERLFAKEGDAVQENLSEIVARARLIYQTEVLPDEKQKK